MNILYISNDSSLYGANRSLIDLATQVKERGHHVYVLIWKHSDFAKELRKNGITPIILTYKCCTYSIECEKKDSLAKVCRENIAAFIELKKHIKKYHIQLIHSNASNVDLGAFASAFCHIPHVWHVREILYDDYKLKYYYPHIMKFLFKHADKVIFISRFIKKKRGYSFPNAEILYNGIDLERYLDDAVKTLSKEEMHLLYVGVIREEKGIMDAVNVVDQLVNEYHCNVKLRIAGKGQRAYLEHLLDHIRQKKLEAYIEYVGSKDDLRELRRWADVALMCSRSEALGRVTIESMLANVLVVGADAGATSELIQDGKNGYLYDAGNIEEMARKILQVYENTEQSRVILKNAKRYALRHFDNRLYADRMLELYTALINHS